MKILLSTHSLIFTFCPNGKIDNITSFFLVQTFAPMSLSDTWRGKAPSSITKIHGKAQESPASGSRAKWHIQRDQTPRLLGDFPASHLLTDSNPCIWQKAQLVFSSLTSAHLYFLSLGIFLLLHPLLPLDHFLSLLSWAFISSPFPGRSCLFSLTPHLPFPRAPSQFLQILYATFAWLTYQAIILGQKNK